MLTFIVGIVCLIINLIFLATAKSGFAVFFGMFAVAVSVWCIYIGAQVIWG